MKHLYTSVAALALMSASGIAFAKAEGGAGSAGLPAGTVAAAEPAANTITAVRSDIKPPEKVRKAGRGGSSPYEFDKLEIGQSFGVVGKTKKQISSTVFGANKRASEVVNGADGKPEMVMRKKRDGTNEMVEKRKPLKKFEAFDVDPKTDPDKASVRVFRQPLPAA